MKILSALQLQEWDNFTIAHEPISSIELMERAANACSSWLIVNHFSEKPIKIFCGKGNNGADGLAIARQLIEKNIQPSIYIVDFGQAASDNFSINLQRLQKLTYNIIVISSSAIFPAIEKDDIVVDALFGTGINKPLNTLCKDLILHINQRCPATIAIDVPSGMFIDQSCKNGYVIKAAYTLSFQVMKRCFLIAENVDYFGTVILLNIGLHPDFLLNVDTAFSTLELPMVKALLHPINHFAHKGLLGHTLMIAGNTGKMGAAILAAKACLRSGVGLLTLNVPEDCLVIPQTVVPEAMCILREEKNIDWQPYASVGMGPGLGTSITIQKLVRHIVQTCEKPMVIDADALNCIAISKEKDWLQLLPKNTIITPHPKEFDRLFGNSENEFERIDKAMEATMKNEVIIVLKGHHTLIAHKGKGIFNTTGNAGMAKGGNGDLLTGVLSGLLAQGYSNIDAALTGVYLLGLAGDIVLQKQTVDTMLPTDLVENLGSAFKLLRD